MPLDRFEDLHPKANAGWRIRSVRLKGVQIKKLVVDYGRTGVGVRHGNCVPSCGLYGVQWENNNNNNLAGFRSQESGERMRSARVLPSFKLCCGELIDWKSSGSGSIQPHDT